MIFLILLFMVNASLLPAGCVVIGLSRRHRSPQVCERCGYDLRGSRSHAAAVCPECGGHAGLEPSPRAVRYRKPLLALGLVMVGFPLLCDLAYAGLVVYAFSF